MKNKEKKIKIAKELELPIDAVTQSFALIGRRGAGKTYLASMIAEQMLDIQAQVIIIDPIGNWWGLRVDADGKSKGKDIFIIGGAHGDVPLASEGGKEIAKLLVEKNISIVLDISEFRKNERKKFVTDFAEEFYQLKKTKPSAVHIFLEESQKFVPQRFQSGEARMVGAWEDIVRLGRNYGIGCSLISQRPQSVNKEVLSQVECLCVLQITGLHERKALEEWIQEAGEDRKLIGYLPGLHQGEGYVWSPSWLRIFKRVNFLKKKTFDTSATPKLGEATKSAKISKMDVEKLRKQMINVVGKINEEKLDRKSLIDEVSKLKRDLRMAKQTQPKEEVDPNVIERLKERAYNEGFGKAEKEFSAELMISEKESKKLIYWYEKEIKDLENKINSIKKILDQEIKKIDREFPVIKPIPKQKYSFKPKTVVKPIQGTVNSVNTVNSPLKPLPDHSSISEGEYSLNRCARKIYNFLYHNPDRGFSKIQIAVMTGYSIRSSGFINAISQLNVLKLLKKEGNLIYIGEIDTNLVDESHVPVFNQDLILNRLARCPREILSFLLSNPHEEFSKEDIADSTGYSTNSSGFVNAISKLNTLKLLVKENGSIKINPEVLEL